MLPLSVQLNAGADERDLYIYVTRSFKTFEQAVFARACEKSTAEGERPQEEGNVPPRRECPLPSDLADAMAAGLQENMLPFERLEETVER